VRVRRGLYRRADAWSEHLGLADATAAAPGAVVCLLSTLGYHALTTITPREVYLAIPRKSRPPRVDYPPVRAIRYGDRLFPPRRCCCDERRSARLRHPAPLQQRHEINNNPLCFPWAVLLFLGFSLVISLRILQ
jgi:hypothetical protein